MASKSPQIRRVVLERLHREGGAIRAASPRGLLRSLRLNCKLKELQAAIMSMEEDGQITVSRVDGGRLSISAQ